MENKQGSKVTRTVNSFGSFIYFVYLFVVIPMIIILLTGISISSLESAVLLFVLGIASWNLVLIYKNEGTRLFEFCVWTFYYVFMAAAPLVQFESGIFPSTTPNLKTDLFLQAAVLTAISALTMHHSGRRALAKETKPMTIEFRRNLVKWLTLGTSILGASFLIVIGTQSWFIDRTSRDLTFQSLIADFTLRNILLGIATIGSLTLIVSLLQIPSFNKILLLLPIAIVLILTNPISAPRVVFLTSILGIAVVLLRDKSELIKVAAHWLAIPFLIFSFPLLDVFRRQSQSFYSETLLISLTEGDFDAFAQIVNSVEYIQNVGIQFGNQFLGVIFFWIPRFLWLDKPIDTGTLLANFKGYSFGNLSAPLVSEVLINFGILGIIPVFYMFKRVIRIADGRLSMQLKSASKVEPHLLVLPFYLIFSLRGSLLQATSSMMLVFIISRVITIRRFEIENV
jgi:hypothetical protein